MRKIQFNGSIRLAAGMTPLALAIAAVLAPPAMAQSTEGALEEIVVTAQKRAENIQDVPMAVTALGAQDLASAKIENVLDLQFNAPNITLAANRNLTIRGVGSATYGGSNDQGVGVLVNGVFIQNSSNTTEYYDLERIEVLRGPQGTLYGRNTTAGVINYISAKPTSAFEGFVDTQFESFEGIRVTGAVNVPLAATVNQRFSGQFQKRDGYTYNLRTDTRVDGRDQYALRSSTRFAPSPATTVDLVVDYFKETSSRAYAIKSLCTPDPTYGCSPNSVSADFPRTAFTIDNLLSPGAIRANKFGTNPSDLRTVDADFNPFYNQEEVIASLQADHDFGSLTLTALGGYRWRKFDQARDFDMGYAPNAFIPGTYGTGANAYTIPDAGDGNGVLTYLLYAGRQVTSKDYMSVQTSGGSAEQYSGELRLASDYEGKFNFLAGAYYLSSRQSNNVYTYVPSGRLRGAASAANTPRAAVDSYAVFGEVYYDITPELKVLGGLRYTHDSKDIRTGNGTFVIATYRVAEADFSATTGRAAISWNPKLSFTDDTNFFLSYSKGFKSGGFNPGNAAVPTFNSEYVTSYELGMKNMIADGRLRLNLSAFLYDYEDLTVGNLVGTLATNVNVPKSKVTGFELEAVALPVDGLRLEAALGLLNAEITSSFLSSDPSRGGAFFQIEGNELPNSPSRTLKLAAEYSIAAGSEWSVRPRVDFYGNSGFYSREFNTGADSIDGWQQLDASISITRGSSNWSFQLFVKNILNEDSITFQEANSSLVGNFRSVFLLDPRVYGVALRVGF